MATTTTNITIYRTFKIKYVSYVIEYLKLLGCCTLHVNNLYFHLMAYGYFCKYKNNISIFNISLLFFFAIIIYNLYEK